MAEDFFRGPTVNVGSIMDTRIEPFDGPDLSYQGDAFPDPRSSPINKDGLSPARVPAYFNNPYTVLIDTIPSATNTTAISPALSPSTTVGTTIALTTAVLGTAANVPVWTPGIPIIPMGTTTVKIVSAIDFGFTTGTTASNSSTVIVPDNTMFQQGQWVVVGGAGSATATNVALITQVQAFSTNANSSIIFVSPAAATALNNAPIGQGNLYNPFLPPATQFGPSAVSASAAEPYKNGGLLKLFNPLEGSCRALNITAASIGSGTSAVTVNGYDIYGAPMVNLLTANGTNIVNGTRAFKYITNITLATAATSVTPANISIGISDIFGLNLRSDKYEYLDIFWNGCWANTSAGWTAALTTSAGPGTIDVRGSVNASTLAVATVASTNGARRLTIMMNVPLGNMINATPLNYVSLYGTAQL